MLQINPFPKTVIDLDIDFDWRSSNSEKRFVCSYPAILNVLGHPVWFQGKEESPEPVEFEWIVLLEFLNKHFKTLITDTKYPFDLNPISPRKIEKAYWDRYFLSSEHKLDKFKEKHNIGIINPSFKDLFIMTKGTGTWFDSETITRVFPNDLAQRDLVTVGDKISNILYHGNSFDDTLENPKTSEEQRAYKAICDWDKEKC